MVKNGKEPKDTMLMFRTLTEALFLVSSPACLFSAVLSGHSACLDIALDNAEECEYYMAYQ